jgi:2-hydroxychromene-2-carboxylate isomerase
MPQMDFFYFFGSCYAYLSVMRISKLAEEAGVEVRWRPFSVRNLMIEKGYSLKSQPTKMTYIFRDVERRAQLHGIPFEKPPIWPTDPDQLANRVAIVAFSQGWGREYTLTSFQKWFEGQALGADESLRAIIRSHGRDPDEVISLANSSETRAQYDQETDAARQLGIFGSPTFAVGQEIFWGDDRLEEALAWAQGRHPGLGRNHGSRQLQA